MASSRSTVSTSMRVIGRLSERSFEATSGLPKITGKYLWSAPGKTPVSEQGLMATSAFVGTDLPKSRYESTPGAEAGAIGSLCLYLGLVSALATGRDLAHSS